MRLGLRICLVLVAAFATAACAAASDFSFTGTFTQDNNVQLFDFALSAPSVVTLQTYSYAGGTNAAGAAIARGGFDPVVIVWDGAGNFVNQYDDGFIPDVNQDAVTGQTWDSFGVDLLGPGAYIVSLMQYDNYANTFSLADGFIHAGDPNFTLSLPNSGSTGFFWDDTGNQRDGHWALDIMGVDSASMPSAAVPEPGAGILVAVGAVLLGLKKGLRRG